MHPQGQNCELLSSRRAAALDEELRLELELAHHRSKQSLLGFTHATMGVEFIANWHHKAVCRALTYLREGRTPRELLATWGIKGKELERQLTNPHPVTKLYAGLTHPDAIDSPMRNVQAHFAPRHGKSEIVSRRAPAWFMGHNPNEQIIATSYGAALSEAMNRDVQRIMTGEEYLNLFPRSQLFGKNVRSTAQGSYIRNSECFEIVGHKGRYKNAGVGGPITGHGASIALIDDPFKNREDADSPVKRQTVMDWYNSTLYTRLEREAKQILVNTRWHERDLSGSVIEKAQADPKAEQWFCLIYPALLDADPTPGDPRTKDGEALWPWKADTARLGRIKATTSAYEWESLFQQRPAPPEGGIVKLSWFQYWDKLPDGLQGWTVSGDLTFKDRGDYMVLQVWASKGADHYLVDQVRDRLPFTGQLRAFKSICQKYPQARLKLIEDAANGAALIDTVKREITGVVGVRAASSKELRLDAVSPMIESGNVYLPNPRRAPWVEHFLNEVSNFPAGAHDDMIDAASMYLSRSQKRKNYSSGGMPIAMGKQSHWHTGAAREL